LHKVRANLRCANLGGLDVLVVRLMLLQLAVVPGLNTAMV
jgi:hypothetical protein